MELLVYPAIYWLWKWNWEVKPELEAASAAPRSMKGGKPHETPVLVIHHRGGGEAGSHGRGCKAGERIAKELRAAPGRHG